MKCALIFAALVGVALSQGDKCYQQLKTCKSEGYTDYSSSVIDAYGDLMKAKGMAELEKCMGRYRCVQNKDCMMEAALGFKASVPECADMAAQYAAMPKEGKEKKMMWEMLKLAADKPQMMLFAKAMCHPDDAKPFAKCVKKAIEPAFLLYGPKFLHKSMKKKECVKALPQECKDSWSAKVESSCSCAAALQPKIPDMKAAIVAKCGAQTFPEGVDVNRIHSYMKAKKCDSMKDKQCYKAAKACMKESMPGPMQKLESLGPAKKAQMMLKFMGQIYPAMQKCFADNAKECVADLECGMEAVGKYKKKVEGCAGLVQRYAFMPPEAREKKKMMKWVELVFGDEMGPQIMRAMCKTDAASSALRSCLQGAVPAPLQPMVKGMLGWKKGAMAACAPKATPECAGRWAAKMADKCSCVTAMGAVTADLKAFVAKKCGAAGMPEGTPDFAAVFGAKKAKYCAAAPAKPSQ